MQCPPFNFEYTGSSDRFLASFNKSLCLFPAPTVLESTLTGHSDAVWSLSYLGSRQQLLSASADGTVKLWSVGQNKPGFSEVPLLKTFGSSCAGNDADVTSAPPASVDWVRVDPAHFVAGYVNAACVIYDVETGKQVIKLDTFQVSDLVTYMRLK